VEHTFRIQDAAHDLSVIVQRVGPTPLAFADQSIRIELRKLFAVKKDPDLTAADLRAFLASRLASYKMPRQIEFRDELPKTNVGKILRRALRDESLLKK